MPDIGEKRSRQRGIQVSEQITTWDAREAGDEETFVPAEGGPDVIDRLELVLLLREVQEVAAE